MDTFKSVKCFYCIKNTLCSAVHSFARIIWIDTKAVRDVIHTFRWVWMKNFFLEAKTEEKGVNSMAFVTSLFDTVKFSFCK